MTTVSATTGNGSDAYLLMYMDLRSTPDRETRRRALNSTAQGVAALGTLVSVTVTTFSGFPARKIIVAQNVGGEPAIINDMVFIVKRRLYQIMTVLPKTANAGALTRRFQAGFRLLPRD